MSLLVLPNELLLMIAGILDSKRDIEALGRTSKLLSEIATKALYQHNVNNENSSSLLWAARKIRIDIVDEMLKCKANVNVRDRNGLTPLLIIIKHGTTKMVEIILPDRKPDLYLMDWWDGLSTTAVGPALSEAAWKGHPRKVKLLLDYGVDVNHQRTSATTSEANALETAVTRGIRDTAKILLDHGVDIEKCGGIGILLNVAIKRGKLEVVKDHEMDIVRFLLNRGADVNTIGGRWRTA